MNNADKCLNILQQEYFVFSFVISFLRSWLLSISLHCSPAAHQVFRRSFLAFTHGTGPSPRKTKGPPKWGPTNTFRTLFNSFRMVPDAKPLSNIDSSAFTLVTCATY